MAILNFQKPDKVIMIESTDFSGRFEFRPLEQGFGLTVGNALRRVLLSSLEGFAITSLRVDGVEHEFSTIKGIVEDVTEIILNLKQVRFKKQIEESDRETVSIAVSGQDQLTAGDLQKFISGFQVLNPDLVICNMDKSVKINMELTIEKGRGFVPAEENKKSGAPIGTIFTDSIYTPIKNVKYAIENFRVEQKTDYEKLIFDIENLTPALMVGLGLLLGVTHAFEPDHISSVGTQLIKSKKYSTKNIVKSTFVKSSLIGIFWGAGHTTTIVTIGLLTSFLAITIPA